MVTLKEHDDDAHTFVDVHVTVVVPVANADPDAGTQTTEAAGVPVEAGSTHEAMWLSH